MHSINQCVYYSGGDVNGVPLVVRKCRNRCLRAHSNCRNRNAGFSALSAKDARLCVCILLAFNLIQRVFINQPLTIHSMSLLVSMQGGNIKCKNKMQHLRRTPFPNCTVL